jgi:aminopeptidase N
MVKKSIFIFICLGIIFNSQAQQKFTFEDTLRGSITAQRAWWDLRFYDLKVKVDPSNKFISGSNSIRFTVLNSNEKYFQIDLQPPMVLDSVRYLNAKLNFTKKGSNAYFIDVSSLNLQKGLSYIIESVFSGKPKIAIRAPWDGGFSWSKDVAGRPFVATSCQNLGSSIWWPCKDHMYDEPDSMNITVTVPGKLWNVSNGQLTAMQLDANGNRTTTWKVKNPINNYGVNINIGAYETFSEVFLGEKGPLKCSYYVLPENLEKAKKQFADAGRTLKAFEHWFGPYPFYEDGYKLVEVPYLGMEHQSSVTYGNKYANGYLGRDLSGTGWGLKWDFIIVHESGHEWFANNITYKDIADMWIHESFTNYSETLFTEYYYGLAAGQDYVIGTRRNITNDKPIIGQYDVNEEGSSDMYYKGGNMLHTIRHVVDNDEKFRGILRGLNADFYHQTVTTAQIENYISQKAGIDFSKVFDQYLRTTKIPRLVVKKEKKCTKYRWENTIEGFSMPVKVSLDNGKEIFLEPTSEWKEVRAKSLKVNRNFYIES